MCITYCIIYNSCEIFTFKAINIILLSRNNEADNKMHRDYIYITYV